MAAPTPAAPAPAPLRDDLSDILGRLLDDDGLPVGETVAPGTPITPPTDARRPVLKPVAQIDSTGGLSFRPELAGFGARIEGAVVDGLAVGVLTAPGLVATLVLSGALRVVGVLLMVAGFVVGTVLYARAVASTGQWFGNRVAGTRVVDVRNGAPISVGSAAARFVVRHTISMLLLLGFLAALRHPQRRTFHDQFAGSIVTRPARETWSIDDEPARRAP